MIRKAVLALIVLAMGSTGAFAQDRWAEKLFIKPGGKEPYLVHDFGTVAHGAQLVYRFEMTNIYTVPLDITDLRVSCGCVTASAPVRTLQPKQTTYVEARMDTTKFIKNKEVKVQVAVGNGAKFFSSTDLEVKANIRQDVVFNPGQFMFGLVPLGTSRETTVEVAYAGSLVNTWAITGVMSNDAPVEARVKQVSRDNIKVTFAVTLTLKKDAPAGALKREIYLETNDPASPRLPVLVEATIQSPLEVSPDKFTIADAKVGTALNRSVKLRGERPFSITKVDGLGSGITLVTPVPTASGPVQTLTFQVQPAKAGDFRQEIKITTSLQEAPVTVLFEGNATP